MGMNVRLSAVILLSCCAAAAQSTIHVPADQPTIQAGIDAAVSGDTVLVAAGTYHERIDFKGKDIKLWSEAGPETTIIDGDAIGSVVRFKSGETGSAELKGFTIRNGRDTFDTSWGGSGIYILNSSPLIEHNIIRDNKVVCAGGGIYSLFGSPTTLHKWSAIPSPTTSGQMAAGYTSRECTLRSVAISCRVILGVASK
jgi:hypothetical protein